MKTFVALKLQGVMQAWGGHTFEDFRHTELIPTRSALLGLLGACLGIDRHDAKRQTELAESITIAVRADQRDASAPMRITDFHTVLDARKVDGKINPHPVVSRREYWCDACYTVLLEIQEDAHFDAERLVQALQQPVYTPFLGRRSCPLSRPLYETTLEAADFELAFDLIEPRAGVIYSEQQPADGGTTYRLRDMPLYDRKRQFASRQLYISKQGGQHAPE